MLTVLLLTVVVTLAVLALFVSSTNIYMNSSDSDFNAWEEDLSSVKELRELVRRCSAARGVQRKE